MACAPAARERMETICELARAFGGAEYVLGGGGNVSCKDERTLWVKPSGTTMEALTPGELVELGRAELAKLYDAKPPAGAKTREAFVKEKALAAVRPKSGGKRPSVEAPLHDSFDAVYVVHTHPATVNGLTCSQDGERACARLFPDALWVPYVDPGYALCMRVREAMQTYARREGRQPELVLLQNHGVFAAGDTPEAIRAIYGRLAEALRRHYDAAGIPETLPVGPPPSADAAEQIADAYEAAGSPRPRVAAAGPFAAVPEPLSPDHIVYCKAWPLLAEPRPEAIEAFHRDKGYFPRVVACRSGVFGAGETERQAELALTFARDGARVRQLAEAFGGARYMERRAAEFIENWEAESYRRKIAEG